MTLFPSSPSSTGKKKYLMIIKTVMKVLWHKVNHCTSKIQVWDVLLIGLKYCKYIIIDLTNVSFEYSISYQIRMNLARFNYTRMERRVHSESGIKILLNFVIVNVMSIFNPLYVLPVAFQRVHLPSILK